LPIDPKNPVALAQALIRCPSVTPEEGGAIALLDDLLAGAGFQTHRLVFSAPGTPDIANLYARRGTERPFLLFAGHTDVVPPGNMEAWTHGPFSGDLADGLLYGRGATDMKGGVAASISAVLRALDDIGDGFAGSVGFLITGDEEGPAINGSVKLLEWAHARGERFDHCILGEPTNPEALGEMIKIGRRGSLTGRIIVYGKQGHVAYPQHADNPIRGMVALVAALDAEPLDRGTAHFDPSHLEFTTFDVGNAATNVIANEARATFNIRFNDLWTPETLETEIRRRLQGAAGNRVRYHVAFEPTNATAFLNEPDSFVDIVSEAVMEVTGRRPTLSTTGGTSDARFIKHYGPVIEFGLVGKTMHQIDEHAAVADIEALTTTYERIIKRYFAK
jgi:succinyl-diaminopimelate desuccinylase